MSYYDKLKGFDKHTRSILREVVEARLRPGAHNYIPTVDFDMFIVPILRDFLNYDQELPREDRAFFKKSLKIICKRYESIARLIDG